MATIIDFHKEWEIRRIIEILREPIFGLDYLTGLYRGLLLRCQLKQEELEQEKTESS
jgi:hypothetical protein